MRKRKSDIGIIITTAMFGVALAVMIAALVCMAADVHIWHILMPQAILLTVVTGLVFVISLALHFYYVRAAKANPTDQAEDLPKPDKRAETARGFGIAALACFYAALFCGFASTLLNGVAGTLTKLFSPIAALVASVFALIAIILSRRSTAEKASLLYLLSLPFAFIPVCMVLIAVFSILLFYIMLQSWSAWGLL